MPWAIQRRGSKFVVVNQDTGAVKGTHDSYAGARSQQKALYVNVPESRGSALTSAAKRRKKR
jgi:hypothetical protein